MTKDSKDLGIYLEADPKLRQNRIRRKMQEHLRRNYKNKTKSLG